MGSTCTDLTRKPVVVSVTPPDREFHELPQDWAMSSELSAELLRRSKEPFQWPRETCARVHVVDEAQIEALFANDDRKPPGWENFQNAFPGSIGLTRISLPAFTANHDRAVVYEEWTCGPLCGTGLYVELKKRRGSWHVTKKAAAWIS